MLVEETATDVFTQLAQIVGGKYYYPQYVGKLPRIQ
jgi:hypothetical protein